MILHVRVDSEANRKRSGKLIVIVEIYCLDKSDKEITIRNASLFMKNTDDVTRCLPPCTIVSVKWVSVCAQMCASRQAYRGLDFESTD